MSKVVIFPGVRRSYHSRDEAEKPSESANSVVISHPHVEIHRLRRLLLERKRRFEQ